MKIQNRYNWKHQSEQLIYVGKRGNWYQFSKVEEPFKVWCEVLQEDLHMLEETRSNQRSMNDLQVYNLVKEFDTLDFNTCRAESIAQVIKGVEAYFGITKTKKEPF